MAFSKTIQMYIFDGNPNGAPGHAGDSREGDEERDHRKFRRVFLRLKREQKLPGLIPAAEKGKKRQQYRNRTLSKKAIQEHRLIVRG